ncbi:oxygenase MpaB family protein [Rhodococcus sp. ACT016]|uniref:oxygenase MpaB family protein n=1 Tax=Rhodococcus sp. ACT016 TaxID=3134808 RepID=UPI003D265ED4
MVTYFPELAARVLQQVEDLPEMYGDFDFSATPERFTTDPNVKSALPSRRGDRQAYLDNPRLVELARTSLYLADVPADRIAALSEKYSVTELVGLIRRACKRGIESVPDAPTELADLLAVMETKPDWIDYALVEKGAARARVSAGLIAPFVTRGAFIATFTNTYAALPMTITGALSGPRAAHRVNETTAYFAVTTLPRALERFGPGFEATAMVRVMHSMVRYNALKRSTDRNGRRRTWDASIYGLPIPQLDQLPAGMIGPYLIALRALKNGRDFTEGERAMVEFYRYRCFLLGLPEELLPANPEGIVNMFHIRGATLRDGFDDDCRKLVASTMNAYLRPADGLFDRIADSVEKSYSKVAFCAAFCDNNRKAATDMGVDISLRDYARIAATGPFIAGRLIAVALASRQPMLQEVTNRYLTGQVRHRLDVYGIPEYVTDRREYAH